MISQLYGKLIEKHPPQIVIDVNGVGYEAEVSMQTFCALPHVGENVRLYTHPVIREDAHLLFGFADKDERAAFRQIIKVSGIGAKTALGILSALDTEELAAAIAQEDVKRLSAAPGIGKKPPNAWFWNCAANSRPQAGQGSLFPPPSPMRQRTLSAPCLHWAIPSAKPAPPPKASPRARTWAKACVRP